MGTCDVEYPKTRKWPMCNVANGLEDATDDWSIVDGWRWIEHEVASFRGRLNKEGRDRDRSSAPIQVKRRQRIGCWREGRAKIAIGWDIEIGDTPIGRAGFLLPREQHDVEDSGRGCNRSRRRLLKERYLGWRGERTRGTEDDEESAFSETGASVLEEHRTKGVGREIGVDPRVVRGQVREDGLTTCGIRSGGSPGKEILRFRVLNRDLDCVGGPATREPSPRARREGGERGPDLGECGPDAPSGPGSPAEGTENGFRAPRGCGESLRGIGMIRVPPRPSPHGIV